MIPEEMTVADLLSWANSLGLCTFKRQRGFFGDEIVCEKGGRKIDMHFGRYDPSVNGGARMIHFGAEDKRNMSGMGAPLDSLGELERYIELYATRLGLLNPQMSLF